jgi:hypothetical protein
MRTPRSRCAISTPPSFWENPRALLEDPDWRFTIARRGLAAKPEEARVVLKRRFAEKRCRAAHRGRVFFMRG